ncbi:golgin candidate 1 isoform X2 [Tanacetum coccineum]
MAHWLKAAEDLFEVVDRRAKLVVGDEQPNSESPASNGQGSQAKSKKSKVKPKEEKTSDGRSMIADTSSKKTSSRISLSKVSSRNDLPVASTDNNRSSNISPSLKTKDEVQHKIDNDASKSDLPESSSSLSDQPKHNTVYDEDTSASINQDAVLLILNGDPFDEASSKSGEEVSSAPITFEEKEAERNYPTDSSQAILPKDKGSVIVINREGSQSFNIDSPSKVNLLKVRDLKSENQLDEKKYEDHKPVTSPIKVQDQLGSAKKRQDESGSPKKAQDQPGSPKKAQDQSGSESRVQDQPGSMNIVQDQLDEAQGLLESSKTTGQSKEARLARVCAGLSSRLQEYKSENAQLEELLVAERDLSKSYEARIQQLQEDLSISKEEVNRVESNMLEALGAKNAEIEALVSSMDTLKKQASISEGNLASLQANMESIMRNRELTETRMMQAIKEELASVERRAEEERAAHNATKMAAMEREVELEHRALDASTALAKIQRTVDERTAKAAELEQKVALLEIECSSLTQELQDMEVRARRGQKKSPEDANQVIQAEVQKMRVEMAAMKRDAEHYSRQEHMELEKRYRELTDLLYYKQTQLEAMTSEKAAAEFQLEKEIKRIREAQVEVERSRVPRRVSSTWDEDDMKALEPLPFHHRHLAGANIQLQKAAKALDTGAVRAMRFLWRYPVARLFLVFYMVFVHLFMMYLLHRLQYLRVRKKDALASPWGDLRTKLRRESKYMLEPDWREIAETLRVDIVPQILGWRRPYGHLLLTTSPKRCSSFLELNALSFLCSLRMCPSGVLVPLGLNRLTMFELYCRSLNIVPSVNLFRVFYKVSKQGHWFSFEKRTGKSVGGQIFRETFSGLKGWKKRFFFLDRRVIPDAMAWRHHDSDVNDPVPEGGFNVSDVQTLTEQIVDLRPVPSGLLFHGGLTTTWDFPGFRHVFKDTEGNVITMSEYLRFPFLSGASISKGPALTPQDQVEQHTTRPLPVDQPIPEKTDHQKEIEVEDPKIVAIRKRKARAAAKKKEKKKQGGDGEESSHPKTKRRKTADRKDVSAAFEATSSPEPIRTFNPTQPSGAVAATAESREDRSPRESLHDSADRSVHNYFDAHHDEETNTLRLGSSGDQSGKALTNVNTEVIQPSPKHQNAHRSPTVEKTATPLRTAPQGANTEAGESSRENVFYVPEWSIHQRCRVDNPMWCRELMVHLAPPAAQEESNALNNATALERAWFSLARWALAQTDILERFENLQADFGELAESHAECGDLARKLVQARLDLSHTSDLYNSLSDRYKAFKSEHEGCAEKLEGLEN